jgi:hypothetical protein
VRTRKDLFQDYDFTQIKDYSWNDEDVDNTIKSSFSPNSRTPSVRNTFGIKPMGQVPRFESITNDKMIHCAFIQYSLKQGLKKFPEEAREATIAEIQQLHRMNGFQPVNKSSLTQQELRGVLNSMTFIKQKRCAKIKARTCADGRPQRAIFEKWEAASPTVRTESVLLTSMVDAYEKRVIAVYDIPGAFLHTMQTDIVHMKMTGEMAEFLVSVCPKTYSIYIIVENGKSHISTSETCFVWMP